MQRAGARGPLCGLGLLLIAATVLSSPVSLTGDADPALRTNPARDDLNLEFSRREIIKVDVEMALINVTVTDPIGRMVTGLDKEHFVLKEDNKPQLIEQFGAEEAPLSLAVVFDASGSMGYKMTKSREAVAQFFKTVNPEDEFFLVQFNNRPEMVTGFTRSLEEIQSRLTFVRSKGAHSPPGCDLPRTEPNEGGQELPEGLAGHFRRRRQLQPLHPAGDQANCARV